MIDHAERLKKGSVRTKKVHEYQKYLSNRIKEKQTHKEELTKSANDKNDLTVRKNLR